MNNWYLALWVAITLIGWLAALWFSLKATHKAKQTECWKKCFNHCYDSYIYEVKKNNQLRAGK